MIQTSEPRSDAVQSVENSIQLKPAFDQSQPLDTGLPESNGKRELVTIVKPSRTSTTPARTPSRARRLADREWHQNILTYVIIVGLLIALILALSLRANEIASGLCSAIMLVVGYVFGKKGNSPED